MALIITYIQIGDQAELFFGPVPAEEINDKSGRKDEEHTRHAGQGKEFRNIPRIRQNAGH
jgi:hypothetical protein